MSLQSKILDQEMSYDGTNLRSHWVWEQTGLWGNTVIAFVGPCDVPIEHMVDLSDVAQNKPIFSHKMLHFIGEFYGWSLRETILLQRLFISQVQQGIIKNSFEQNQNIQLIRQGNDLYEGDKKLSVSIATQSPTSTLIHIGINIDSTGTPVPTKGLQDYQIEPRKFAEEILGGLTEECRTLIRDLSKVRAVK